MNILLIWSAEIYQEARYSVWNGSMSLVQIQNLLPHHSPDEASYQDPQITHVHIFEMALKYVPCVGKVIAQS